MTRRGVWSERAAGTDVPATVLLGRGWRGAAPSVRHLARRLARQLAHEVEPYDLDEPDRELPDRLAAQGTTHLVLLPLTLDEARAAGPRGVVEASALFPPRPGLRVHRGRVPATDDVARMLGDRARDAAASLMNGARRAAPAVVVIATGDGANPAGNAEVARLARLVYEAERFADVTYAFVGVTTPAIGEVVARWARLGAGAVVVVPYLLFERSTYRRLVEQARAAATATRVKLAVARPLDGHPALAWALVRRHLEALADDALASPGGRLPWVNPELLRVLTDAHDHGRAAHRDWEARLAALLPPRYRDAGLAVSSAPMAAAPLERDADGRVAWERTWQGFCELALAGGPPHRGTLLEAVSPEEVRAEPERYAEVQAELARGLRAVTGLPVVPAAPAGWIGLECRSEEMALWLMRAIVVENVMVRREGAILYLPAGPRFTIDEEIKNVVTAVAKTHHYWMEHEGARRAEAGG